MAALYESVAINVEPTLFGIESGKENDLIIISNKKGFINTFKISDQKLTSSLPIRHGVQITSAAIWNQDKQEYLLVQNKQDVRLWDESCTSLDKARRRPIPVNIHRLFSLASYEPFVLCENGSSGFLGTIKDTCKNSVLKDTETIIWSDAIKLSDGICILFTVNAQDEEKLVLHSWWYNSHSDLWQHKMSSLASYGVLYSCACTSGSKENQIKFFTLWKNGNLCEVELAEGCSEKEKAHPIVITGATEHCALFCLSSSHIALVGLLKDGHDGIGIMDTKFRTVQAWQPFPDRISSDRKIFCQQEHIFVHCGKTLYMYRYECHTSTLATILGQQKGAASDTECMPINISFTDWKASSTAIDQQGGREILVILNNLADSTQTSSYTGFKREFGLLKSKVQDLELGALAYTNAMSLLLRRCCTETKFWPNAELEYLILQRCISSSTISLLFEVLVSKEEVGLLYKALKVLDDVPESCLVMALHCFLKKHISNGPTLYGTLAQRMSHILVLHHFSQMFHINAHDETLSLSFENESKSFPAEDEMKEADSTPETSMHSCPFSRAKLHYVNQVLCYTFSDAYLLESLRKLPFNLVLDFLRYLQYMMKQPLRMKCDMKTPSTNQVFDWLAVTIDAHATHLILAKDAHDLLITLHQEVEQQINFCVALGKLEPLLKRLKTKCAFKQTKSVGQYCIEVLHLT